MAERGSCAVLGRRRARPRSVRRPECPRAARDHGDDGSVVERAQEGSADSPSPITHAFTAGATIGVGDREHLVESYPAFGEAIDGRPCARCSAPADRGTCGRRRRQVGFTRSVSSTTATTGRRDSRAAVRRGPRPREKLRDRAHDRRDAAAERPARDVAVDGGRDGRRAAISRQRGAWTSAATGSTRSRCERRLGFVVGDVVGKGCRPRRRWRSSGTGCGR